jgi:hypothetical protein
MEGLRAVYEVMAANSSIAGSVAHGVVYLSERAHRKSWLVESLSYSVCVTATRALFGQSNVVLTCTWPRANPR